MRRRIIRITEEDLNNIVQYSVASILNENLEEGKWANKALASLAVAGLSLGAGTSCSNDNAQQDQIQGKFHSQVLMPNRDASDFEHTYSQEKLDSIDNEVYRKENGRIKLIDRDISDAWIGDWIVPKGFQKEPPISIRAKKVEPSVTDTLKRFTEEGFERGYKVVVKIWGTNKEEADILINAIRKTVGSKCDIEVTTFDGRKEDYSVDAVWENKYYRPKFPKDEYLRPYEDFQVYFGDSYKQYE